MPFSSSDLTRRHNLKRLPHLLLPLHLILAVNLGAHAKLVPPLGQQSRPRNDRVRAHDFLLVVDVRGAARAVVAVDGFAAVALVGVDGERGVGFEVEGGEGDDLVEGEGGAGEEFAGVAVAGRGESDVVLKGGEFEEGLEKDVIGAGGDLGAGSMERS